LSPDIIVHTGKEVIFKDVEEWINHIKAMKFVKGYKVICR